MMLINRDNYETIFLLYLDNELPVAQRKIVEEFVKKNPDLKEELLQLQQVILPSDKVVFTGKSNLYRSQITDDALQEKLLMHLDSELDKEAAATITALIAVDEKLNADWELLLQTKLDADEKIIFKEKNLLYRKERDNVVLGRFVRWAIAAAIIGAGFFVGITILNKGANNDGTAENKVANKNNTISVNPLPANAKKGIIAQLPLPIKKQVYTAQQTHKQHIKIAVQKTDYDKAKNNFAANLPKNTKTVLAVVQKNNVENKEELLLVNNLTQRAIEKSNPETTNNAVAITPKIKPMVVNTFTDTNVASIDNNMARSAGLTDIAKENNADRILYMNEETLTRSKAGGFFRQLKRVVERSTKIKTDKGLHIGGFELALK